MTISITNLYIIREHTIVLYLYCFSFCRSNTSFFHSKIISYNNLTVITNKGKLAQ